MNNSYDSVVQAIKNHQLSEFPIPSIAKVLGVKRGTINSRLLRKGIPTILRGRRNYVSREVALKLVEAHKTALMGWITLEEAEKRYGIKKATLKARCEKHKLEGYPDLTKRLRVKPEDVANIILGEYPHPNHSRHALELDGVARVERNELLYDPDNPPSLTECVVGRIIIYGRTTGIIRERTTEEAFRPLIKVDFEEGQLRGLGKGTLLSVNR